MKNTLFLLIILTGCVQNNGEKPNLEIQNITATEDTLTNEDSLSIETEDLIGYIEKYNETGDKTLLKNVLLYYKGGLNQDYIETFTPLYYGLTLELIEDQNSATKYYKQALDLAKDRINNPLDGIEYEFDVKTEKELIKIFKEANAPFDIEEFKSKRSNAQKYWLYVSQIALGEDKYSELNELLNGSNQIEMPFGILEIKQRSDIFHLITGWEN